MTAVTRPRWRQQCGTSSLGGVLVHAIRRGSIYWRRGRVANVYVTWRCGTVSPAEPLLVPGIPSQVVTCRGCRTALGLEPLMRSAS